MSQPPKKRQQKSAAQASTAHISRFPIPPLNAMEPDIRERIEAVQAKSGFIPNIFLALAHRPDEFRAFFALHDSLVDKDDGLSKAEREMIIVVTSALNQCLYCVIAHGAILRIRAKDSLLADKLAVNYLKAELEPRQRVMLDYASKVCMAADSIEDEDFEALEEAGFDQEEIWDIGAIAALFAMSNRLANVMSLQPNAEFYALAR
ncbi:peroxidase-related enzyme [Gammaproteobacteria bacterium]|nr:peroxidase-related enzyme [Gammaproteobacteria bacterium]